MTLKALNLLPESIFVLVVILLVMPALNAFAAMAAFACRPQLLRARDVKAGLVVHFGPIGDAACSPLGMPN